LAVEIGVATINANKLGLQNTLLKFQDHLRSSISVHLESPSAVLVTINNKSVPICNQCSPVARVQVDKINLLFTNHEKSRSDKFGCHVITQRQICKTQLFALHIYDV